MDTRLTASQTFSDLNFTTLLEVGIITFILKLRNCYFETLNDLAKVSDPVAPISWHPELTPGLSDSTAHGPYPTDLLLDLSICVSLLLPFYFKPGYMLELPGELLESTFAWASPQIN